MEAQASLKDAGGRWSAGAVEAQQQGQGPGGTCHNQTQLNTGWNLSKVFRGHGTRRKASWKGRGAGSSMAVVAMFCVLLRGTAVIRGTAKMYSCHHENKAVWFRTRQKKQPNEV